MKLLQRTCEPWTDITVSKERLSQWPEQGDLVDLNDQVVTIEDNKEQEQSESNNGDQNQSQDHASQIELNNDGDNYGPAPLHVVVLFYWIGLKNKHQLQNNLPLNINITHKLNL